MTQAEEHGYIVGYLTKAADMVAQTTGGFTLPGDRPKPSSPSASDVFRRKPGHVFGAPEPKRGAEEEETPVSGGSTVTGGGYNEEPGHRSM